MCALDIITIVHQTQERQRALECSSLQHEPLQRIVGRSPIFCRSASSAMAHLDNSKYQSYYYGPLVITV